MPTALTTCNHTCNSCAAWQGPWKKSFCWLSQKTTRTSTSPKPECLLWCWFCSSPFDLAFSWWVFMVAAMFSYSCHAAWDFSFCIHFSLPWIRAQSFTMAIALLFSDALTLICLIPGLNTTQSPHSLLTDNLLQATDKYLPTAVLSNRAAVFITAHWPHGLPLLQHQKLQSNAKPWLSDPKDFHGRSTPSLALFHMQSSDRTSHL